MNRSPVGILLVGHGSHLSPDSSTPVLSLARRLEVEMAERGFEVRTAFWKEEPELRIALDLMESREVCVIPVFTSEGYFTGQVVPRELQLEGPVTLRGGRRVHYSPPVGVHPGMARIVLERAAEAVPLTGEERGRTTLVVVGHGTVLHPESGDTTRAVAGALVGEGYREVLPAFMDQDPKLETVLAGVSGRVVVVPFFISEGWHAGMTIPRDLAGFELHYARAVGTHPGMAEVVLEIVEERLRLAERAAGDDAGDPSDPLPSVMARTAFTRELAAPDFESKRLFQVEVRRSEPTEGIFEVRHLQDWSGTGEDLRVIDAPDGGTSIALRSDSGAHRPLRTSPDLAGGWCFVSPEPDEAWRFLDRLYPGALVQKYLWDQSHLPITTFREMAARQTGIHARVGELGAREVPALVEETCAPGRCLRTPVWQGRVPAGTQRGTEARPHDALDGVGSLTGNGGQEGATTPTFVPCPAPCSIFISAAARRVGSEE